MGYTYIDDGSSFSYALFVLTSISLIAALLIVAHLLFHHHRNRAEGQTVCDALMSDPLSCFLLLIMISVILFFVDYLLLQWIPGIGHPMMKSFHVCAIVSFLTPFASAAAAMWCACASHFLLLEMTGVKSLSMRWYHLIAWGIACSLGLAGVLWNALTEGPPVLGRWKQCLYPGEYNERNLILLNSPMLLSWCFIGGTLLKARHYLKHHSTGTHRNARLIGGRTFQQYFLAVLVISWLPIMIWELLLTKRNSWQQLPYTRLGQFCRLNLALSGFYTCLMYVAVMRGRGKSLADGLALVDAKCIHFPICDLEDGSSELWRDSQERMIESNKRDAVAMLYPHVVTLLAALSPDAPNSYGAKATQSIVYHSEHTPQELVDSEQLLKQELQTWLSRSAAISQRRLTGLVLSDSFATNGPHVQAGTTSLLNQEVTHSSSIPISQVQSSVMKPAWCGASA